MIDPVNLHGSGDLRWPVFTALLRTDHSWDQEVFTSQGFSNEPKVTARDNNQLIFTFLHLWLLKRKGLMSCDGETISVKGWTVVVVVDSI